MMSSDERLFCCGGEGHERAAPGLAWWPGRDQRGVNKVSDGDNIEAFMITRPRVDI